MSIEDFQITTMTASAQFNTPIQVIKILPLITLDDEFMPYVSYGKIKRQKDEQIQPSVKRVFGNTISTSLNSRGRRISIKIFCTSIHMCGLISIAHGQEIAERILDQILSIKRLLKFIEEDKVSRVVYNRVLKNQKSKEPLGKILESQKREFPNFKAHLDWLYSDDLSTTIPDDFHISGYRKIMVNYKFRLPYRIHKQRLYEKLREAEVYTNYEKCISEQVTVIIKVDDARVTFLVREKGTITQSGPNEEVNNTARSEFLFLMAQFKDEIKV